MLTILAVFFCLPQFCSTDVCTNSVDDATRQSASFEAFESVRDEELVLFQTHLLQTRSGGGRIENEINFTASTQASGTATETSNKTVPVVEGKAELEFRTALVDSSTAAEKSNKTQQVVESKPELESRKALVESSTAAEASNKTQQAMESKPELEFRKMSVESSEQLAESRKPLSESSKPVLELKSSKVSKARPPLVDTRLPLMLSTPSMFGVRQHMYLMNSRHLLHLANLPGALQSKHSELLQDDIRKRSDRSGVDPEDVMTPERYAELYRPVSATVRDTIILSVLSLLIYSSLALTINLLELSNESGAEPSDSATRARLMKAAKELQVKLHEGVALVKYVPLFACQFVAMRMYVLAVTSGEGEPPIWVKRTMDVTTGILIARALCLLLLPTKLLLAISPVQSTDHKIPTDEKVVELEMKPFEESLYSPRFQYWAKAIQVFLSITSVAGNLLIIVGIWSFATWHTSPSPPIIVTSIVSYICIVPFEMLMWTSAPLRKNREWAIWWQRFRRALRYGVRCLRKAPMFGVLMLADRMRAMQINPPGGRQQTWAYVAMVAALVGLFMEVTAGNYIGYFIMEAKDARKDLFPAKMARHLSAFVFYLGVFFTAVSIFLIPNTAQIEGTEQLSTTLATVVMLTAIYYSVHGAQWIVAAFMDWKDIEDATVIETLLGSGVSVNICPLLGILYVACRMRALQISDNQGAPQWWAQDAMHMSTFGVLIQVVMAVLMPIFTGSAPTVASDGSPRYDKEPLALAYLVIIVKWVALFAIHGSAFTVIISVFAITPESALAGTTDDSNPLLQFAQTFLIVTMVFTISLVVLSSRMLGLLVKLAIESVDKDLLGVEIDIDKVLVSLWQGKLTITNLQVMNPDNHEWRSPSMISMKTGIVDIAWRPLLCEGIIEIEVLAFNGLEVNYERPLEHFSNVHFVLDKLKKGKKKKDESKKNDKKQQEAKKKEEKKKKRLILHQLSMSEIVANLISTRIGTMFTIVVPSIHYADYAKETGQDMLSTEDIVVLVLHTLLDTIIHNLGCKALLHGAEHLEHSMMHGFEALRGQTAPKQDEEAAGQPSQRSCFSRAPPPEDAKPAPISELTSGY